MLDSVKIVACLHPFNPHERIIRDSAPGLTVRETLDSLPIQTGVVHVYLNGEHLGADAYDKVMKAGDSLAVRVVPGGEGAQQASGWGMLAGIAIIVGSLVAAPFTGGLSLGAFMVGWGIAGVSAAVGLGAAVAANASADSTSFTSNPSIRGASNAATKWARVPVVFGTHLVTPQYGALPWTEISETDGENQYVNMVFCLGHAPLKCTSFKLGETLLASNAATVQNGLVAIDGEYDDVTLYVYQNGTVPTGYGAKIVEEALSKRLEYGVECVATTASGVTKISVDITANSGLYEYTDGDIANRSVTIVAKYRIAGSGAPWSSATTFNTFSLTKAKKETLRYTAQATVAAGQYEVMLQRLTADADDDFQGADVFYWTALRSIFASTPPISSAALGKYAFAYLRIRATDQLNGTPDKFNVVASAPAPAYLGSGSGALRWADAYTSNPASILLKALADSGAPRPLSDDKIDWVRFEEWYTYCETKGWKCNAVEISGSEWQEVLRRIAQTGRADYIDHDGVISVAIDKSRTDADVVQHFSPLNARGFSWSRSFPDLPHAYRVAFVSEDDGYSEAERIVYDPDYTVATATKYEQIDLWGVTDPDLVYRLTMMKIAISKLRPIVYSWEADIEAIVCELGDLVVAQHWAILKGIDSGTVNELVTDISGNITGIIGTCVFKLSAGSSYAVRLRAGRATIYKTITPIVDVSSHEIAFDTPISASAIDLPMIGDMLSYGLAGVETGRYVIIGIDGGTDFGRKIYAVDEADAVHTADSGAIPAWASNITPPVSGGLSSVADRTEVALSTAITSLAKGARAQTSAELAQSTASTAQSAADAAQSTATAATTSLAPAAIAQYNPAYTPELPDDPAGVTYQPTFATTDSWTALNANVTMSAADNILKATMNATGTLGMYRNFSFPGAKAFIFSASSTYADTFRIRAVVGGVSTIIGDISCIAGEWCKHTLYLPAGTITAISLINISSITRIAGTYLHIKDMQIGTGAYLSPTLDTSGNGNHLTNTAAVPVDYNGRKWWAFNGASAYLLGTTGVLGATGIVWGRIRTPATIAEQYICGNSASNTGFNLRVTSAGVLLAAVFNGSSATGLGATALAASTEYTFALVFTATTAALYIDGVSVATATVAMAAGTGVFVIGRVPSGTANYWGGYIGDFYVSPIIPTAAQIRDLYVNGLPAELYTLTDYRIDTFDDDGKLSVEEKSSLKTRWLEIYYLTSVTSALSTTSTTKDGDFSAVTAEAIVAGLTAASAEVVLYVAATNAIRDLCWNSSTGVLNNMAQPSTVTAGALDELLSEYRTAYNNLRKAITNQRVTSSSTIKPHQANDFHQFPVDSSNVVTTYEGSGNTIQVFEGITELQATTGTPANGEFKVTTVGTNITPGAISVSGKMVLVANASAITQDAAYITFTITGKTASGTSFTIYASQSFSKSRAGADGVIWQIRPSTNVVQMDKAGNITPATVSATRYSTTGSASPAVSTVGTLKYKRSGDASETTTNNGTAITIRSTDTYIDFYWYDVTPTLREYTRVPLIANGQTADMIEYVPTYAPRYIGPGKLSALDTATFTGYTVELTSYTSGPPVTPNKGDWMLNFLTDSALTLGVYVWDGSAWALSTDVKYVADAMIHLCYLGNQSITISGYTTLMSAMVKTLFAQTIELLGTGYIKSTNYAESSGTPTAGFKLDAASGLLKAYGAVLAGLSIGSSTVDGSTITVTATNELSKITIASGAITFYYRASTGAAWTSLGTISPNSATGWMEISTPTKISGDLALYGSVVANGFAMFSGELYTYDSVEFREGTVTAFDHFIPKSGVSGLSRYYQSSGDGNLYSYILSLSSGFGAGMAIPIVGTLELYRSAGSKYFSLCGIGINASSINLYFGNMEGLASAGIAINASSNNVVYVGLSYELRRMWFSIVGA